MSTHRHAFDVSRSVPTLLFVVPVAQHQIEAVIPDRHAYTGHIYRVLLDGEFVGEVYRVRAGWCAARADGVVVVFTPQKFRADALYPLLNDKRHDLPPSVDAMTPAGAAVEYKTANDPRGERS